MITVEFVYFHKISKKWIYDEKDFNSIDSALKFIKYVIPKSPDMVYSGFRCDDLETLTEMNNRL